MDYDVQNAVDSAVRDCERKIDDLRWSLERDIADLRREVSRLEGQLEAVRINQRMTVSEE